MCLWFALPDGTIVESIMREDKPSGRYTSIVDWRTVESTGDEMLLARRITTTSDLAAAFAKAVESYYNLQTRLQRL